MHPSPENIAGKLYDGILDHAQWYAGLDSLRQMTQSSLFHHAVWDRGSESIVGGFSNDSVPPETLREFDLHHAPTDPRIPLIMRSKRGDLMLDHQHLSARDISRSPIYVDWLAPLGYRHTLGMVLHEDERVMEMLALIRPVDHSSFEGEAESSVRQLMPALLRASRLRASVNDLAAQASFGIAALDTVPQGVALVDISGRLYYANNSAQRTLAGNEAWRLRGGLICAIDPSLHEQLFDSLKLACSRKGASGSARKSAAPAASVLHAPPGPGRTATTLRVLPLHPEHSLAHAHRGRPYALLIWAFQYGLQHLQALAATLGLTLTEARLALALAQGQSVKDFAHAQDCSWHTARTHMRNLLQKTGTHRQQDVATMVRGII